MNQKQGFTLIELLVVIAIISLLSSIVFAGLNTARAKARDASRVADFRSMNLAMELYYDTNGMYPNHIFTENNSPQNHRLKFEALAQELVDSGFLSAVPYDPVDSSPYYYMYHKYTAGNPAGALIVTRLESINSTTVGPFNSCRTFTSNWCSHTNPSNYYCLCHPY